MKDCKKQREELAFLDKVSKSKRKKPYRRRIKR